MRKIIGGIVGALVALAAIGAIAAPANAAAAPIDKQLWHIDTLDAAVSDVAGTSLKVVSSDSDTEWLYVASGDTLGFTCIACRPGEPIHNGYDGRNYDMYRTIWIAPDQWRVFQDVQRNGLREGMDYFKVGEAMLTLDHEGQHWRLFSHDENRVNACALADLPRFLSVDFGLAAQVQQTISVPQTYSVRVRSRVKVNHRWVYHYRYLTRTRYVPQTVTVPNPIMTGIIAGAQAFYRNAQPSSYNTGTCW